MATGLPHDNGIKRERAVSGVLGSGNKKHAFKAKASRQRVRSALEKTVPDSKFTEIKGGIRKIDLDDRSFVLRERIDEDEFPAVVGGQDFFIRGRMPVGHVGGDGVPELDGYTHTNINDLGSAVQQMTPLPLTSCTGQTTQPDGSTGQSMVALMVAGFPDNHSGSVRTAEDHGHREHWVKLAG